MLLDHALESNGDARGLPLGVLVIDDQLAVRQGVARLIACSPVPMVCVGTAATATEGLDATARARPEVVVLDVDLAGEDGLALIPALSRHARVLVLTSHGDVATRERAAHLGACAFIEKHQPAVALLDSIAKVGALQMRGEKPPASPGATAHPDVAPGSDAGGASIPKVQAMDVISHRSDSAAADEVGAAAIEYALVASLIAVFIVVALQASGDSVMALYTDWSRRVFAVLVAAIANG
jgi:DNA-binding NarL/FixJ family response regulator